MYEHVVGLCLLVQATSSAVRESAMVTNGVQQSSPGRGSAHSSPVPLRVTEDRKPAGAVLMMVYKITTATKINIIFFSSPAQF